MSCFIKDEQGGWLTYTFDEHSMGTARGLTIVEAGKLPFDVYPANLSGSKWGSSSSSSDSAVAALDTPANILHTPSNRVQISSRRPSAATFAYTNEDNSSNHNMAQMIAANSMNDSSCLYSEAFSSMIPSTFSFHPSD